MENAIEKAKIELEDWWDICSIKADINDTLDFVKVDIYDMMAMMASLNELDLLRADEVEVEM